MRITNECLEELLVLEETVKSLNDRIKEIKEACKEKGTFTTKDYACIVSVQTRKGYVVQDCTFLIVKVSRITPYPQPREIEA